ncbi:hypothetical protein [Hymenobacter wooponensis]|uniref:Uncharacterized protein n=1 Tax=Hymenobacter wooponensis TaxID=1525360 RepID=A0A4Z0MEQ2_9BACT|nr:hypothetical protein [Hymenobacter wooponensis]TGD78011.1 hypothetical protein EU557_22255 [Hymenobacter wooponensis]
MQKLALLSLVLLSTLFVPRASQAQVVTDGAAVALDSLMQMVAKTRYELNQMTKVEINAPRMGLRRHIVRGYNLAANPGNLPINDVKRLYVWKQRTRYLRNGQIRETFVAQINNQKVLQERRLNGSPIWLKLARGLDMTNKNPANNKYVGGTYIRDGYFIWNGVYYALPKAKL